MRRWKHFAAVQLAAGLACLSAEAAEVTIAQDLFGRTLLKIEGPIESGDSDVVKSKAAEAILSKDAYDADPLKVHLNTPGGDVQEAMKIGRFLREILAEVDSYGYIIISPEHPQAGRFSQSREQSDRDGFRLVDANKELGAEDVVKNLSAGVLIFFGGVKRAHRDNSDERLGWPGQNIPVFGIHRPYFAREAYASLGPNEADLAYTLLIQNVENYLREMGAPGSLIELMLQVPSDEILYLDEDQFRALYSKEAAFLSEWLISRCGSTGEDKVLSGRELADFRRMQAWQSQQFAEGKKELGEGWLPNPEFDENYSSRLLSLVRKHNIGVDACRTTSVIDHQRKWASQHFEAPSLEIGSE